MAVGSRLSDGHEFLMGQVVGEVRLGLEVVDEILHQWVSNGEEEDRGFVLGIFCNLVPVKAEAVVGACGRDVSFEHHAPLCCELVEVFFQRYFQCVPHRHESTD